MSEFNPEEESRGYRERSKKSGKMRREPPRIAKALTPTIPEEPSPNPTDQLTPFGKSRRRFLKGVTIATVITAGGFLLKDFWETIERWIPPDQREIPGRVKEVINFLEEADLQIPQDSLYGFTFPSTKEMAQKYKEALEKEIGNPPHKSLEFFQETQVKNLTESVMRIWFGIKTPMTLSGNGVDIPDRIYLPEDIQKDPNPELARWFYHEGFHLFYQPPKNPTSDQELFDSEIQPNISDILLERALANRGDINNYIEIDIKRAYDQAIKEKNPEIFEKELKNLYKLPQDCCTYQPPENSKI